MAMKHDHEHCKHEDVAYCGHCQVVYCKGCKREWGDCKLTHYTHYPYAYPQWTYTTPQQDWTFGTGDTITISNDATGANDFCHTSPTACSHA